MPFRVPEFEETHQLGLDLSAKLLPDDDTSVGSLQYRTTGVTAGVVYDNHVHTRTVGKELLPDMGTGAALDRWGTILGLPRKGSTGARKANALRITGVVGEGGAAGTELVHDSGFRYAIEAFTIPAAGYIDVDVAAIDTGSATRLNAGESLTFVEPILGIATTAELQIDLDEDGTDAELDGPYRDRLLQRLQKPPLGGAAHDYERWAREVSGVARAFVYPLRAGYGTVDVVALHSGSGSSRAFNPTERAALLAYLESKRPVGVAGVRVLETVAAEVDCEVLIRAASWDWIDSAPPVVASWNAGTRTLTLAAARPITMAVGGRVVIATAGSSGAPIAIESLPVTTTQIVLEKAPTVAPSAGDLVYAGSSVTAACRAAILAHYDELGPANDLRYDGWEGTLRPQKLQAVVGDVPGAMVPLCTAPASDIAAADLPYPNDATIGLIVPRRVLVRRRWS
ncbi:MAG: baseplate J/gp47 family protein [Bosea sp. (in: a-proteobacteria)]